MKRLLLVVALVFALAVPAIAAPPASQVNTGCGLGALLFKEGGANNSLVLQVIAQTLNGGSGVFGITSGTSECAPVGKTASIDRLNEFAERNFDDLARDIAAGKGETVTTVAVLLDVPVESRPAFYQKLQSSFSDIFPGPTVDTAHVVTTITRIASQG